MQQRRRPGFAGGRQRLLRNEGGLTSLPDERLGDRVRRGRGRFLAGLGVAQIVSWGTLYYAFPLVAVPMERELGLSKPEIYGAATFGLTVGALAAYPVGAAIDDGRGRAILAGGSALSALLLLGWSQVASLAWFYLLFAGIGVAQAMTLYEPVFAVIARRDGADARDGITALTLWGGFASTVFVPLTQALIDGVGWRGALVAMAGLHLAVCLPIHLAVVAPAAGTAAAATPLVREPAAAERGRIFRWAIREPVFWALFVSFTLYYGAVAGLTYHLYPLLLERGFEAHVVVAAMAIIGPAQVAGRVVLWWAASDRSVRQIGMATVVALPAGLLALWLLPASFGSLALFALVYGAANGVMTIVRGLAVPEMLTKRAYGEVNGLLAVPGSIARATAPVGAALLWELQGSYGLVLAVATLVAAGAAASFWVAAIARGPSRPAG